MAEHEKKGGQHTKQSEQSERLSAATENLLEDFSRESDRASVILVAAILDEYLTKMFKFKLVQIPSKDDPLFDGTNAPMESFGAKIRIAYRLGLISEKLQKSLDIVRGIRNEFAHDISQCAFNSQSVRARLSNLRKVIGPAADNLHEFFLCESVRSRKLVKAAMRGSRQRQQFLASAIAILFALKEALERIQSIDKARTEPTFEQERHHYPKPLGKVEL